MTGNRIRCFFDVDVDSVPLGRIIFELFDDICPKTCENFRALCTGEMGLGETTKKLLHYRGVKFHRVIKDFMIQAGDFSAGNGTGGESIYGGQFEDENFEITHNTPFLLSMANRGKDTNGSQFFITTQPASHLDGKHVAFGRVISGQEVVVSVENLGVDNRSRPLQVSTIANCGELVLQRGARIKSKEKKKKKSKKPEQQLVETDKKKKKHKEKKSKQRKLISKSDSEHTEHEERQYGRSVIKGSIRVNSDTFQMNPLYSVSCINPDEIPDVPKNRFLDRGGGRREEDYEEVINTRTVRSQIRSQNHIKFYTKSGRKVKGRGALRYRTPSHSLSRSRSRTPPHWRQAQRRTLTMERLQRNIEREEHRRADIEESKYESGSEFKLGRGSDLFNDDRQENRYGDNEIYKDRLSQGFRESSRRGRKVDSDWRVARQKTLEEEVEDNIRNENEKDDLNEKGADEMVDLRDKLQGNGVKFGANQDTSMPQKDEPGGIDDTVLNYEASSGEDEIDKNIEVANEKLMKVNEASAIDLVDDGKQIRQYRKRSLERWHRGGGGGARVISNRRAGSRDLNSTYEQRWVGTNDRRRSGNRIYLHGKDDGYENSEINLVGSNSEKWEHFGKRAGGRSTSSMNRDRNHRDSRNESRRIKSPKNQSRRHDGFRQNSRSPPAHFKNLEYSSQSLKRHSKILGKNDVDCKIFSKSPKNSSKSHKKYNRRYSISPKRYSTSPHRHSRSPRNRSKKSGYSKNPDFNSRDRQRKSSSLVDDLKDRRYGRDYSKSSDDFSSD